MTFMTTHPCSSITHKADADMFTRRLYKVYCNKMTRSAHRVHEEAKEAAASTYHIDRLGTSVLVEATHRSYGLHQPLVLAQKLAHLGHVHSAVCASCETSIWRHHVAGRAMKTGEFPKASVDDTDTS